MSLLVIALGVALLTIPAVATSDRVSPATRTRTSCLAIAGGLTVLGLGLTLTASPLVMWSHGRAAPSGLDHLSPGGPVTWLIAGLTAGFAATSIAAALFRTQQRRRQAAVPPWAAETQFDHETGIEVRVVPLSAPLAFAVSGRDPHIVVSQGMRSALLPEELSAVIAHESAHLRLRHDRHLLALYVYRISWGWLPGVHNVTAQLNASVEEWADLEALASLSTDRRQLSAAVRAVADLGPDHHNGTVRSETIAESKRGSSLPHTAGIVGLVGSLLLAASATISHSVGDLAAVIAAIH